MKVQVLHTGRVKNGKLIFDIQELWDDELRGLEGNEFQLTIKKKHRKATMSQYGYYRGGILPACYESEMFKSCNNKDEIHDDYFAPNFLRYTKMVNIGGKNYEVERVRSLADLSVEEMKDFIDRVIADCELNGIRILPPETFYNKYYLK